MHSIRTKITLLTVCSVLLSMSIATALASVSIRNFGNETSERILFLLCQTVQRNLDAHFESIRQSVETMASYAESDLEETSLEELPAHLERVKDLFEKTASNTNDILTYYYRIDPEVSPAKGFWFVDLDGAGFQEHEVTDISLYDTEDQSAVVWFTVPKATGRPIWLSPYFTENLDVYVLSYNIPIYKDDLFIGVIGIEMDFKTIAEQVGSVTLYENGYAFVNDKEGTIVYHPHMSLADISGANAPRVPDGLLSGNTLVRYSFEGSEKQAVWLPLSNGMNLYVTVPVSEINSNWQQLIAEMIVVALILVVLFAALAWRYAGKTTKPLRILTSAAETVNSGNYNIVLDYNGKDEVGILTNTFANLIRHLNSYITDLNSMAYADGLTKVRNKRAFDLFERDMQEALDSTDDSGEFAIGVFDCDNLKQINDHYGHDKGDIYLKTACSLICHVFQHSPVFRTGGDEFTVILQGDDYRNLASLTRAFAERGAEINARAANPWEEAHLSMGIAAYTPGLDENVIEVTRRADRLMYDNKRQRKSRSA